LEASVTGDTVEVRNGTMQVPQGPDFSITIDERVIERYRVA
jgi:L-alanine-DL-glutamate epimerase-like enolase superfamily enzyme